MTPEEITTMARHASTYRATKGNVLKAFRRAAKNDAAIAKANQDTMIFGTGCTYKQPNGVIRYVEPAQWVKL